jgi:hypothetical protein
VTTQAVAGERCAVHPSHPAYDRCPVCDRPRCSADIGERPGCGACGGAPRSTGRPPLTLRGVVGAAVACSLVWPLAGAIASQYVEVAWFSTLVPAVAGVGCGLAAPAGARGARGWPLPLVAVFYALVATAYGYEFEPAGVEPGDVKTTGLPYLTALVGAAWAYVWSGPPKPRKGRGPAGSGAGSRRPSRRSDG